MKKLRRVHEVKYVLLCIGIHSVIYQKLKFIPALILGIVVSPSILAATLSAEVIGVVDGDTVKVIDDYKKQYKIRLDQIDAPEAKQAFGQKSKQYLSNLVFRKKVSIEWNSKDRYGRILGTLYYQRENVNYRMVKDGYAWAYTKYLRDTRYSDAQQYAEQKQLGLWKEANPIPPWEWRRKSP